MAHPCWRPRASVRRMRIFGSLAEDQYVERPCLPFHFYMKNYTTSCRSAKGTIDIFGTNSCANRPKRSSTGVLSAIGRVTLKNAAVSPRYAIDGRSPHGQRHGRKVYPCVNLDLFEATNSVCSEAALPTLAENTYRVEWINERSGLMSQYLRFEFPEPRHAGRLHAPSELACIGTAELTTLSCSVRRQRGLDSLCKVVWVKAERSRFALIENAALLPIR